MAVVAIVATCCSVEDDNSGYPSMTGLMGNNGQMPNGMMPGGMGQNDNSGNDLQDFDISLNTAALTNETENIPTDENDESYEDYVEHSSFSETVSIVYADNEATVSTLPDGVEAIVDGAGVIINSTIKGVAYELKGSSSNGYFKIYSEKKFHLTLNGVSLTNPTGAAINIQSGKRVFVTLADGTSNSLVDGTSYNTPDDEDEKGTFFSEGQLVFNGKGSLEVTGNKKHGIVSDDYIRFLGKQTVNVSSSAGHGIRGKDYILVDDGTINVSVSADMKKGFSSDSLVRVTGGVSVINVTGGTAFDDEDQDYSSSAGIKADKAFEMTGGSITITNSGKGGKGIRVGSSSVMETLGTSYVSGGSIDITTTGATYPYTLNGSSDTKSPKGIKIGWAVKKNEHTFSDFSGDFIVTGGTIAVRSTNAEAIEVKKTLEIQGGEVYAWSQTEDAINSASTFTISGGYVCGISLGNDALDANGNFYVKGGVVFASGASNPEVAIDANTEGGFKLYVTGGTIFALGGLESGASLSQSCYQISSWSTNKYYSVTVGEDTYVFKTPSKGGSKLVVSGASKPEVKSNVTVSGGTTIFDGCGVLDGTVSGGTAVSLSAYTSSGGGPGGRW